MKCQCCCQGAGELQPRSQGSPVSGTPTILLTQETSRRMVQLALAGRLWSSAGRAVVAKSSRWPWQLDVDECAAAVSPGPGAGMVGLDPAPQRW